METANVNTIDRKLVLHAPLQRVWDAIGTSSGFEGWFNTKVEGEWTAGAVVKLRWPSGNSNDILVHTINPPLEFAYKWHPGDYNKLEDHPEAELTTVTMKLREIPEGTELHLIESGFDNIPDERRLKVLGLNTEGWDEELENIRKYVEE